MRSSNSLVMIGITFFSQLASVNMAFSAPEIAPDAGQILQQIERDKLIPIPQRIPELEEKTESPTQEIQQMVVVKEFKFEGNKVLNEATLRSALAQMTGRSISMSELKTSVDIISALYRQKGYLAIATLPEQDITEGLVLIHIVEAVFGGVKFEGQYNQDFKRVKPEIIQGFVEKVVPLGQALDQDSLNRSLILVNDLPGISVRGNLNEGSVDGRTDVLINVKDKPLLSGSASLDNTGGRSTGREKVTVNMALSSPLHIGDSFNLTALHTEGLDYGRIAYSLPVGYLGWRVGASASYLEYDVITFSSTQQNKGLSSTFGLDVQYPIIRTKTASLNFSANADEKYFTNKSGVANNFINDSNYKVEVYSLALSADRSDAVLSGANNTAVVNIGMGRVNLDASPNQGDDLALANTQGQFSRLRWSLSRNQFFTDTVSLSVSGSGQFADKNLDSSEKFYLGGVNGVRAYPSSEGSGSAGFLFSAELRKYLPYNFVVSSFVDYGHVKQFQDNMRGNNSAPIALLNGYNLKGLGANISWTGPYNSNLKATYAHRVGGNPNPTAVGNDQDGSLIYTVFWLSGGLAF